MEIVYSKAALKALSRIPPEHRKRIQNAVVGVAQVPPLGDFKPLHGEFEGHYRLRIGGYRVIYHYDSAGAFTVLAVTNIGLRGDIYKKGV